MTPSEGRSQGPGLPRTPSRDLHVHPLRLQAILQSPTPPTGAPEGPDKAQDGPAGWGHHHRLAEERAIRIREAGGADGGRSLGLSPRSLRRAQPSGPMSRTGGAAPGQGISRSPVPPNHLGVAPPGPSRGAESAQLPRPRPCPSLLCAGAGPAPPASSSSAQAPAPPPPRRSFRRRLRGGLRGAGRSAGARAPAAGCPCGAGPR